MPTHPVRIISTTIDVPMGIAYSFTQKPENFPKWASGLSTSLRKAGDQWVADTPAGAAVLIFSDINRHGVLDHRVRIEGKPEIYVPMRMLQNGDGTEVELVLFRQPEMSDADFARDAATVGKDLATLKDLLERRYPSR